MKASERLEEILDRAFDGPLPSIMVGLADGANGKVDIIARMAYIAGIKRALEIVNEYEQKGGVRDGNTKTNSSRDSK